MLFQHVGAKVIIFLGINKFIEKKYYYKGISLWLMPVVCPLFAYFRLFCKTAI